MLFTFQVGALILFTRCKERQRGSERSERSYIYRGLNNRDVPFRNRNMNRKNMRRAIARTGDPNPDTGAAFLCNARFDSPNNWRKRCERARHSDEHSDCKSGASAMLI